MKLEEFETVRHFTSNEKWGDISKVQPELVYKLDANRRMTGKSFILHCAFDDSGHSDKSQHYLGGAADGHYKDMPLLDQFLLAERSNLWGAIGIYPFWNNPGLHKDIRGGEPLRWIRDKAGIYHYNPSFEIIANIMRESSNKLCKI